jgi:aspartate/methionine/tyrosine aminotransferase
MTSYHTNWISIISFSKGYGLPGIRIGAIITQNSSWYESFLAAKETIQICNPPIEEAIAYAFYTRRLDFISKINAKAQSNLRVLIDWLDYENRVEAILPQGGLVCFIRIKTPTLNFDHFYKTLFDRYGLVVGPGHWFDMTDDYMRVGFGYPEGHRLKEGLGIISKVLDEY